MPLNSEQLGVIKQKKAQMSGIKVAEDVSRDEARRLLNLDNLEKTVKAQGQKAQSQTRLQETGEDIKQTFGDIKNTYNETKGKVQEIANAEIEGEQGKLRSFGQAAGTILGGASKAFGDVVKGIIKISGSQEEEQSLKSVSEKVISDIVQGAITKHERMKIEEPEKAAAVESLINNFKNLDNKTKRDVGALMGITQFAIDAATAGSTKKIVEFGAEKTADVVTDLAVRTGTTIAENIDNTINKVGDVVQDAYSKVKQSGVGQKTSELVERVPRAYDRVKEGLESAAMKAEKIKASPPAVQRAYKANLDEKIINTVVQADEPTKQAYKQMVDIAGESSDVLKIKKKPSSVAGEVAAKQYKLIEDRRKEIGKQMSEVTKKLSKEKVIEMEDGFKQIDDVLGSQDISIRYTRKGPKLNFSGSKFTPAERTRIQELYSLAVEGGNKLSPNQIRLKDQLFSKLQREARMEGIGDIMVETPEGVKSLFSVFRDIYSNKLDEVSPEIKELNKQYRQVRTLLDDIEGSITKGGNFEIVKGADPAIFAQTNLRRILSDAQSAGSYSEIVKKMDEFARELGYTGARADELILFAEELKKLFPDTIPKAGFAGGISTGVKSAAMDVFGKVLKTGTPDLKDQQKALIELLKN